MSRQFFGITRPYGSPYQGNSTPGMDTRPALVRRVECHTCPHLIKHWLPVADEAGNMKPKYECDLLDVKNQKIYEDNLQRHPSEQLPFYECVFGDLTPWIRKMPTKVESYY